MISIALASLICHASPVFVAVAPGAESNGVAVDAKGQVKIGGAGLDLLPVEKGIKRRVAKFAATQAGNGDTLILADSEVELTENGETAWVLDDMLAARVDKSGKRVWRQILSNRSGDPTRDVFVTDQVIILRERDGVEGIDAATGKKLWDVDRDPLESVLNDPQFWHAKLDEKSQTLWLSARFPIATGDGRRAFELELDAATGQRVFKQLAYVKPKAAPIYVRPEFRLEYASDRAPPEVPTGWDGLRIHRSFLAWNKTTREGIVVDPLKTDVQAIVAAAKAVKVKGASVKWLYVFDLGGISAAAREQVPDEAEALKGAGAPVDPLGVIKLVSSGAIARAGERVDAKSVALALGAQALDGANAVTAPPRAKAGGLVLFRPSDDDQRIVGGPQGWLCLHFGPYFFAGEHEPLYRQDPY